MIVTMTMNEKSFVTAVIILNLGAAILDAVIDSFSVEQARKDPEFGQADL